MKVNFKKAVIFAIGFLLFFYVLAVPQRTFAATVKPAIFLLPHQDDEMFMLGTIRQKIEEKIPVFTIMVTDGSQSHVHDVLNGVDESGAPVFDVLYREYHRPSKEHYRKLETLDFVRARNYEYYRAMLRIGVPASHILFANPGGVNGSLKPLYQDRGLSDDLADEVIATYYKFFGDGTYYTVDANRGHSDHQALHRALLDFTKITDKHFFSERIGVGAPVELSAEELRRKTYALDAYYEWWPQKGRFAIGAHSVATILLNKWRSHHAEYLLDE